MLGAARQNLSYSLRTLARNKGFTVTAVLTLALGIGATTAIFSVVNAVFEPMPYPKPDQLVMVWSKVRGGQKLRVGGRFSGVGTTQHVLSGDGGLERRLI